MIKIIRETLIDEVFKMFSLSIFFLVSDTTLRLFSHLMASVLPHTPIGRMLIQSISQSDLIVQYFPMEENLLGRMENGEILIGNDRK